MSRSATRRRWFPRSGFPAGPRGRRRGPVPTACSLDSQSAQSAEGGEEIGFDKFKHCRGRKRNIVVDTLGFTCARMVASARVSDRVAGREVLAQAKQRHPGLRKGLGRRRLRQRRRRQHAAADQDCSRADRPFRPTFTARATGPLFPPLAHAARPAMTACYNGHQPAIHLCGSAFTLKRSANRRT